MVARTGPSIGVNCSPNTTERKPVAALTGDLVVRFWHRHLVGDKQGPLHNSEDHQQPLYGSVIHDEGDNGLAIQILTVSVADPVSHLPSAVEAVDKEGRRRRLVGRKDGCGAEESQLLTHFPEANNWMLCSTLAEDGGQDSA